MTAEKDDKTGKFNQTESIQVEKVAEKGDSGVKVNGSYRGHYWAGFLSGAVVAVLIGGGVIGYGKYVSCCRTAGAFSQSVSDEWHRISMSYDKFMEQDRLEASVAESVTCGMRLAKAYPYEKFVQFRYDGIFCTGVTNVLFCMVVRTTPVIQGQEVVLKDMSLESFDLIGVEEGKLPAYENLGDVAFVLFRKRMKVLPMPIWMNATEIVEMTNSQMVVR